MVYTICREVSQVPARAAFFIMKDLDSSFAKQATVVLGKLLPEKQHAVPRIAGARVERVVGLAHPSLQARFKLGA
jgi:hypothetical protein